MRNATVSMLRLAAVGVALAIAAPAFAQEGGNPAAPTHFPIKEPEPQSWTFAGPFGKFDEGQLQRGYQVYKEVCSTCHSMKLVGFRNLSQSGGPGFTEAQVKALAATFKSMVPLLTALATADVAPTTFCTMPALIRALASAELPEALAMAEIPMVPEFAKIAVARLAVTFWAIPF